MILKSLILKNFRAYKDIKVNFDENMNVIIGQNDVGKSTILEALDIFFGQEVIKIDITDFNKDKEGDKIVIGVEFEVDDNLKVVIDTTNPTNLKDEFLLNENGFLEILKEYEINNNKLKEKILINANYPSLFDMPLINIKIPELKKLLATYKLTSDSNSKSAEIRKTLYENLIKEDTEFKLTIIDISKIDEKSIWESLEKELPLYFLFQSDRANKDSDGDIQNPLKSATKKIVADFEEDFKKIKNDLEAKLIQIGTETITKMKDMGLEVANNLIPKVSNKNLDSLFSFSLESDDGIALNKRGSGFRRMVMLNYFRAEAERKIVEKNNKNVIYAIEEPETAQHPNHQKMLIEALIELSNKDNHQIIITTHTPEIAKMVNENNLIIIKKDDKNNPSLIENKEDKLKAIVETLGIHPFFNNKVVICVEGEYDIKFLTNVNQCIDEYKNIIDLDKEKISLIPLQGGNLKNWVNRNYLKDSNIIEVHIYDRDSNSGKNTEQYRKQYDEINGRDDKSYAFMTEKKELENYIHKSIIQNEFNITLDDIENYDIEDIPTFIKNKSTNKDENAIKGILNGKLSKQITKEHLEELQAFDEIKSWFEKIKELSQ
ncbi:ATP-binding protein [Aliarcobacter butzleri]|uniref:ATP-binding protein n=3 Tax=Aliarcobacter butzleri TaxID=28197 RepID=UPI001260B849|nr:ATP-binding protein [Aliarcobacter butzleri]MDK2063928.1 ATP-binding protein [Aliarcobacter butzleri]